MIITIVLVALLVRHLTNVHNKVSGYSHGHAGDIDAVKRSIIKAKLFAAAMILNWIWGIASALSVVGAEV